jgi:hypothetical protein
MGAAFGFRTNQRGIARAVAFAEGVSAGGERNGFLVVHGHAGERFADVTAGGDRIRIAVRAFRVHVDQAHLHGRQGVFEIAVTGVTALGLVARGQPFILGTPVDVFFRLPDVLTSAAEAEGLESHRFKSDIAREDHQVGPGELFAVFLLDRPKQPARLVEVYIIGPTVEGRKALVARPSTAAAVGRAVGTRAVPCHADEEPAVVTVVGRPPVLRIGHQVG